MFRNKTKILFFTAIMLLQSAFIPAALAGFLNVRAYASDTVAGYASLLKSSMLSPGKNVVFVVEGPDYSVIRIPSQADPEGIARADLYGQQTKLAGNYRVALNYPGTADVSPQSSFTVYPDQVSVTQSLLSSSSQMIEADGRSRTFLTVTLYDAYRNPIKDHAVQLISSRTDDQIDAINAGITDSDGRASFKITSKYSGISVFTAMDASANRILTDREEIVFYASTPEANPIGGSFFTSNVLQANIIQDANAQEALPGPVQSFDIEDVPGSVKVNTDQTLTIIARDKNGNTAKNYTGTILISTPDDENAVLPNNGEYTFKEADQGKFTFSLALRFSQVGNQYIQILDKNDWKIAGEYEVKVVPAQTITIPVGSTSLMIKSPVSGAVFGSNLVIITGQGDPNINLKIFDDDVKIGETETDSDGFFSFQAGNLSGGSHSFYAMSDQGDVSSTVSVNVDTIPPALNFISITPDGVVTPGQSLNITVNSEPNLDQVNIRIQGIEKELLPDPGQSGSYSVIVGAPAISGSFPVDVILVDSLSNKSELINQKAILVETAAPVYPPTVENPEGVAGDSEVLVTWDAVQGHETSISYYRVSYGSDMNKLDKTMQTQGDETSLKITGLTNSLQHFFTVSAIDSKGLTSLDESVIIAVTPVAEDAVPVEIETPENELAGSAPEQTTPVVVGTPATIGMPPASLYGNPLMGTASSNAVTLAWQPFPGVNAAAYKIYFGLNPGQYDDYIVKPGTQTNFVIQDLINNIPYYFAVVALDFSGNEISPLSAQFTITPAGSAFQSLPSNQVIPSRPVYTSPLSNFQLSKAPSSPETGADATWLVVISVLAAGSFYFYKKRLIKI